MPNVPEVEIMWTIATKLLVDVNMSEKDIKNAAMEQQLKAEELIDSMR